MKQSHESEGSYQLALQQGGTLDFPEPCLTLLLLFTTKTIHTWCIVGRKKNYVSKASKRLSQNIISRDLYQVLVVFTELQLAIIIIQVVSRNHTTLIQHCLFEWAENTLSPKQWCSLEGRKVNIVQYLGNKYAFSLDTLTLPEKMQSPHIPHSCTTSFLTTEYQTD